MIRCIPFYVALLLILLANSIKAQAPVNDNCENATLISIPGNGYNTGNFKGLKTDVSNATLQKAEQCVKDLEDVGNCTKSVWYKFYIPTTRNIAIVLTQKDSAIPQIFAGFNIYSIPDCNYTEQDIEGGLPPLNKFGVSGNSCLKSGWYLIQVGCKKKAKGELWVELNVNLPSSDPYDNIDQYYDFGLVKDNNPSFYLRMNCASIEPLEYLAINDSSFSQSVWFSITFPKNAIVNSLQISNLFAGSVIRYRIFKDNINNDSMMSKKPFLEVPSDGRLIYQNCPTTITTDQKYFVQLIAKNYNSSINVFATNSTYLKDLWNTPKTDNIINLSYNSPISNQSHNINCESLLKSHACKNAVPSFYIRKYKQWQNGQIVTLDDSFFYGTYTVVKLLDDGKFSIKMNNSYSNHQLIMYSLYAGDITKSCNLTHIVDTFMSESSWYGFEHCLNKGTYTIVTAYRTLAYPKVYQSLSVLKYTADYKYYYPKTPEKLRDFNPRTDNEILSEKTNFRPIDTTLTVDTAKLYGRMTFREIYISESGDFNIGTSYGSTYIFGGQLSQGTAKTLSNVNYRQSKSIYGFYKTSWGTAGECFYLNKGYYTIVSIAEKTNNSTYSACSPYTNWVNVYPNISCPSNNNTAPKFAYPVNYNEDVLSANGNLENFDYIFGLDFCKDCRSSSSYTPTLSCAKQKYVTAKTTFYYYTFFLGENATFKSNINYELYEGNAVQNPGIVNDYKKIIDPCDNNLTICNLKGNTTYTLVVISNYDQSFKSHIIFTKHIPSINDFAKGAYDLGHFTVNDTRASTYVPITCHTNGLKSDPGRYSGMNYYGTDYVIPYKDSLNKKRATNYKNLWYTFTVSGNTKITINSDEQFNSNSYNESFSVFRYRGPYHQNFKQTLNDNFDSTVLLMKYITTSSTSSHYASFYNDTCGESRYFVLLENRYIEKTEAYKISVSTVIQSTPTDGDFCSNAMSGSYTKFGSYTLTTNNSCHTFGKSPFETTNPGFKSTWFKIKVSNVQKFDLQIKANARYGLRSFNVYGGTCKAMTRITSAADAYSYFTLSCMGNGDYFIQAISTEQIDDIMEFQVDIIKPVNTVCKPYDFKFPIAQFKLSGGCHKQDTVSILNLSTAGEDIQYQWLINGQLFSTAFQPFFTRKHPLLQDSNTIRLIVRNTAELTKDTFELAYIRDTIHYQFTIKGPAISHCSDTLKLSIATNYPHKLNYKWYYLYNTTYPLSYLPTYTQNGTSNTSYIARAESDNCKFSDTFDINFVTSLKRYRDTSMCQWQRYVIKNKGDNYMYINNQYLAMGDSMVYNYSANLHIIYYEKNCYYSDSVKIKVELGAKNSVEFENVYVCNVKSFKLQYKKEPLLKYTWNTGDTTPAITATQNGVYRVKGPFSKCRNLDYTWKLTMEDINTHLLRDTTVCKNATLDFYNVFGSKYQVLYKSPNTTNIKIKAPLKKVLKVKRSECYIEDSSMVNMFPDNGRTIDSFMCNEKPTFAEYLDGGIAQQYNWFKHNGSGRFLLINNYGNYPVSRKDNNGCTDTLNYNIITNCEFRVYVPNALTPNADNMNETFGPYISGQFTRYSMNIYTRWGELVYQTDKSEMWNGHFDDKKVSDGVYCYFITVYDQYNKPYVFKGTLTILY